WGGGAGRAALLVPNPRPGGGPRPGVPAFAGGGGGRDAVPPAAPGSAVRAERGAVQGFAERHPVAAVAGEELVALRPAVRVAVVVEEARITRAVLRPPHVLGPGVGGASDRGVGDEGHVE